MKIPQSCRWQPTGQNLGEGGAAEVQLVLDRSREFVGQAALKALRPNKLRIFYDRFRREWKF